MHDYDVVWSRESIYDVADIEIETVFIIRVLRHERNWQKMLREGISYTFD